MAINLGNVVGLLRSQLPPTKTYILWGKILNPAFPDIVELNYYDPVTLAWTPVTDPTTQHWLRPVIDNATVDPPAVPSEGDRYMIPAGATGVWTDKTDQITTYRNGAWVFQIPLDGFIVSVRTQASKLYDYRGTYGAGGTWVENDFQVPIAPGDYIPSTEKGSPLGVCELDSSTLVPGNRINGGTLPYTPNNAANWPQGLSKVAEALDHLALNIGSGGNPTALSLVRNISKAGHGFIVGDILTIDNTGTYVKITQPANQRAAGIVSTVIDVDNIQITVAGSIGGLAGLVPGSIYYVQSTGNLSTSFTPLQFLLALSETEGYIIQNFSDTLHIEGVNTSDENLDLDMKHCKTKAFTGSDTISVSKIWSFSNPSTVGELTFRFTTSGFPVQTLPISTKMSDARWNSANKTWTPLDEGEYLARGFWDGTNWFIKIEGPFN